MYDHVHLKTTILPSEIEDFSAIQREIKGSSAGTVRAMVRYCLARDDDFINWVHTEQHYGVDDTLPKSPH